MQISKSIFVLLVLVGGCSPLDRYLGLTPIETSDRHREQLARNKANTGPSSESSSSSSQSGRRSAPTTPAATSPATDNTGDTGGAPDHTPQPPDNMATNTFTGGAPYDTAALEEDAPLEVEELEPPVPTPNGN